MKNPIREIIGYTLAAVVTVCAVLAGGFLTLGYATMSVPPVTAGVFLVAIVAAYAVVETLNWLSAQW